MTTNHFQEANKLKQEGKLEEAIVAYHRALEQNPNFYLSHHNLGEALAQIGCIDEAVNSYQRAIELNPNSAWSHHNQGEILAKLGQLDAAIVAYCRAIAISPVFSGFYNNLGKALYRLAFEINLESLKLYRELGQMLPKSSHEKNYSTDLYYLNDEEFLQATDQLTQEDFVEKVYRTYLKREADENGRKHWINLLGDGTTRQHLLDTFRQSPEFTSLLIFSTVSFCLEEAMVAYRHAIELSPNSRNSYQNLEEALVKHGVVLGEYGQLDRAIESFREVVSISQDRAQAHYNLGNALLWKSKLDEAIEHYQQALAIKPNWAEACVTLGNVLLQRYRFEEATESYERALSLEPNWPEATYQLANSLLQQGKLEEATESYERALSLEPNRPEIHFWLGNTLLLQGKYEDALACHRKALTLNPDWGTDAYFNLGFCLLLYPHHLEGVIQIYEQALALKPDWIDGYYAAGNWLHLVGYLDEGFKFWDRCTKVQKEFAQSTQQSQLGTRFFASDFTRAIGHTAFLDTRIKLDILGWLPQTKKSAIWAPSHHYIANSCMVNYWNSYFPVVSDPSLASSVKYAEERNATINLVNGKTIFYAPAAAAVQKQWESENRPPLLILSASDRERGTRVLRKLGVPTDAWFVCLHVREAGIYERDNPIKSIRNADITTYLPAMRSIASQGGWVIRMGDSTMKPLPGIDRVIDYAHSDRKSDWMDVFLWSQCRFFLGTTSGPYLVPPTFGVPCVLTNWAPLSTPPYFGQDIFIPKLYWLESERRYLTFAEQMSPPIGHHLEYIKPSMGLTVMDNTAQEINDLVLEMLERLDSTVKYEAADDRLQEQFNSIAENFGSYRAGSRIGQNFLRKYAYLLEAKSQCLELKEFI